MKKVIILGAGTVGQAVAKQYFDNDCSVCICDDNPAALDSAAVALPAVQSLFVKHLNSIDEVKGAIDKVADQLGGLNGFVFTKDVYGFLPFETMTSDQWHDLRKTCLDIPFVWGQQIGTKMRDLSQGEFIIYVMRDLCTRQDPIEPARCATQWGLKGLIRSMAVTFGKFGVAVNGIATDTLDIEEEKQHQQLVSDYLKDVPSEIKADQKAVSLTGRPQTREDVAQLCEFLTFEAINVSGQVLLLDGGMSFI